MAISWEQAFKGKVTQESHHQSFALEGVTNRWTCRSVTQTFEFEGLDETSAASTAAVTVTDAGGTQYTITPKSSFTDASTGTLVFPVEVVSVNRAHMSPHLWRVTVQRTGTRYYLNGTAHDPTTTPAWAIATGEF